MSCRTNKCQYYNSHKLDEEKCVFHAPEKELEEFGRHFETCISDAKGPEVDMEGFVFPIGFSLDMEKLVKFKKINLALSENVNIDEIMPRTIPALDLTMSKGVMLNLMGVLNANIELGEAVVFRFESLSCHFEDLEMHRTHFEDEAHFSSCSFSFIRYRISNKKSSDNLYFTNCIFFDITSFGSLMAKSIYLISCNIEKIDFLNAARKDIHIQSCYFGEMPQRKDRAIVKYAFPNLKSLLFDFFKATCPWHFAAPTTMAAHQEVMKKLNDCEENEYPRAVVGLHSLKTLYENMKTIFEEERNFRQAGDFHYWEMELRKIIMKEQLGWRAWFRLEYFFLKLYKWFAAYGESYRVPGLWAFYSIPLTAGLLKAVQSLGVWDWISRLKGIVPSLWSGAASMWHLFLLLVAKPLRLDKVDNASLITSPLDQGIVLGEFLFFALMLVLATMALRRQFKR